MHVSALATPISMPTFGYLYAQLPAAYTNEVHDTHGTYLPSAHTQAPEKWCIGSLRSPMRLRRTLRRVRRAIWLLRTPQTRWVRHYFFLVKTTRGIDGVSTPGGLKPEVRAKCGVLGGCVCLGAGMHGGWCHIRLYNL